MNNSIEKIKTNTSTFGLFNILSQKYHFIYSFKSNNFPGKYQSRKYAFLSHTIIAFHLRFYFYTIDFTTDAFILLTNQSINLLLSNLTFMRVSFLDIYRMARNSETQSRFS